MCAQCKATATQTGVPMADVYHLFHAADVAEAEYDAKMDSFFDGVIENARGWLDQ